VLITTVKELKERLDAIKNAEINTKNVWVNIEERGVDTYPLISYTYRMKDREINIKVENITQKQWANLLIELNLVSQAWKPYGPNMKIKAYNLDRIIKWGKKTHDDKEDRYNSKSMGKNKRPKV